MRLRYCRGVHRAVCNLGSSVSLRDHLGVFTRTFLWTLHATNSILSCALLFRMGHALLATAKDPLRSLSAVPGYNSPPFHRYLCFLSIRSPPLSRWSSLEHCETKSKPTLKTNAYLPVMSIINYKVLSFPFAWFGLVSPCTLALPPLPGDHSYPSPHSCAGLNSRLFSVSILWCQEFSHTICLNQTIAGGNVGFREKLGSSSKLLYVLKSGAELNSDPGLHAVSTYPRCPQRGCTFSSPHILLLRSRMFFSFHRLKIILSIFLFLFL